jgi:protein arginine N-methyltransferase 3
MATLEQAPRSTAAKEGEESPSDALAVGLAGLKVDRGIARRAAAEHVRTVRKPCAGASFRRSAVFFVQVDSSYFDSYSYFDIHRDMLGDVPRTSTYREALECNPSLMNGARVLDVGCGTGILSLFAARGGAAAVVGVDGSERMAATAAALAADNGFGKKSGDADDASARVRTVAGKVEDLASLPFEKFDVLVSEWMGYFLLFESMLDTVLHARDRFLKPGGAILPDIATMHIAGFSRVRPIRQCDCSGRA